MSAAAFSVQLPSWAGLRPQQSSASSLIVTIPNPNLRHPRLLQIRMGGGPRTFPGGVTKWQWKRMQQKKSSQMLKARLLRERQLYEMRKRAELKAAMAATKELEKPWEKTAPTLFSVTADVQLQTMADRFVKPGAVDLWTENDGPHHFLRSPEGKPSVRVFPKDALHSTKPYARVFHSSLDSADCRSARSGTFDARSTRSGTSPEQAAEYPLSARERNCFSNSGQRDFSRVSMRNTVGFRRQDGNFRGNFQYSEKSERYKMGKGREDSISRPGGGVKGFRGQDGRFSGDFQYSEKSERFKLRKGSEGSISRPGGGVKGLRSREGRFRGDFQYSERSERHKSGKSSEGSISRRGSGVQGFRDRDGKFRGNFQHSISRRGTGVKGSGVSLKKFGGQIPRLNSQEPDNGYRESNGYLQMNGVQSFAGFDLAKGSWQQGRDGRSSNEDDYDNVEDGSERKSFF